MDREESHSHAVHHGAREGKGETLHPDQKHRPIHRASSCCVVNLNNQTTMNEHQIAPGIYPGLGMTEYHNWKLDKSDLASGPLSNSVLKAFAKNPYAWKRAPDFKPTKAMATGSFFDAAITDPDTLGEFMPVKPETPAPFAVSPYDSYRTAEAKAWKNATIADGKRPLKRSERAEELAAHMAALAVFGDKHKSMSKLASDARCAVMSHAVAGEIMKDADFQVGVVGEVPGGIPAKCLIDILPRYDSPYAKAIVDYKTISTGLDDESVRKAIGRFGYHWQAAWYINLTNKAYKAIGSDRRIEHFILIFQDPTTLEVRVVRLDPGSLANGTNAVKHALLEFVECAANGIRSRYANEMDVLELMPFHADALTHEAEIEAEGAV